MSRNARIVGLNGGEDLFFINFNDIAFAISQVFLDKDPYYYEPKIRTLIRIMDTPEEDIYHNYIEQNFPPTIRIR